MPSVYFLPWASKNLLCHCASVIFVTRKLQVIPIGLGCLSRKSPHQVSQNLPVEKLKLQLHEDLLGVIPFQEGTVG